MKECIQYFDCIVLLIWCDHNGSGGWADARDSTKRKNVAVFPPNQIHQHHPITSQQHWLQTVEMIAVEVVGRGTAGQHNNPVAVFGIPSSCTSFEWIWVSCQQQQSHRYISKCQHQIQRTNPRLAVVAEEGSNHSIYPHPYLGALKSLDIEHPRRYSVRVYLYCWLGRMQWWWLGLEVSTFVSPTHSFCMC